MTNTLTQGLEQRYQHYKQIIQNLTLMDDTFMRNVFKEKSCVEYILQVIMERKLHIIEHVTQKDYKNLQGRSVILDCVAVDETGKQFDIEMQQENEGATPKRARYHSGLMDMNILEPGQTFDDLPQAYVIFITKKDILGYDMPIYHIQRTVKELQTDFNDESYIIYVNSKKHEDTELVKLMHDFHCKNADDMNSEILAKKVRELKETPKGVDSMCRELEELYNNGIEIGIEIGENRGEKRGEKKGENLANLKSIKNVMSNLQKTAEEAMDILGINEAERSGYLEKLK